MPCHLPNLQSTGIADSSSTQLVVGSKQIRVQVGTDGLTWSKIRSDDSDDDVLDDSTTSAKTDQVTKKGCDPCCRHLPFEQVWFCGHSKNGGKYILEMAWHLKQREQFLSLSVQQLLWIGKCVATQ